MAKNKPWICNECGKSFPFQSVLLNHTRLHTGEKPFHCDYCDKSFAQKASLTVHERQHTGQRPYVCETCGKGFASQGNMKIHERQHTGVKPYSCSMCPKRFSTIGGLKTHEVTHSALTGQPTVLYPCDECGKSFTHRSSVYAHKKRHEARRQSLEDGATSPTSDGTPSKDGATFAVTIGRPKTTPAKTWQCRFCDKRFPYKHPLVAHERVHTGEKPFSCQYCDKRFAQQTSLIMHERSHTGERRYKCEICEKRFIQPAALRAHIRTHTKEKPFMCPICFKSFAHSTSLRQHQLVHANSLALKLIGAALHTPDRNSASAAGDSTTDDAATPKRPSSTFSLSSRPGKVPHICPHCGKTFAYLSILESHLRVHSGEKPFACEACGKRFAQKATLSVHSRVHTGDKPYRCSFCDRAFAQYGSKSVHEKSHLDANAYVCPTCCKTLSSPSALHTHKKTHGERAYQCQLCPKSFTLNNYLKLHVKQVHMPTERCHQCVECGKTFAYSGSLTIHMRCHNGQRPYVCKICSKAFASQGNLKSHERIHTGLKMFVCKICTKAFAQRSQLNVHEFTHVENRSKMSHFACKFCSKKFAYASSLYIHTRLHTGERPYKCQFCDKRFTNQGNMRVHERVHTKERPFRCVACDKGYAQKVGLKVHMERCRDYKEAKQFLTRAAGLSESHAIPESASEQTDFELKDTPNIELDEPEPRKAKRVRKLDSILPRLKRLQTLTHVKQKLIRAQTPQAGCSNVIDCDPAVQSSDPTSSLFTPLALAFIPIEQIAHCLPTTDNVHPQAVVPSEFESLANGQNFPQSVEGSILAPSQTDFMLGRSSPASCSYIDDQKLHLNHSNPSQDAFCPKRRRLFDNRAVMDVKDDSKKYNKDLCCDGENLNSNHKDHSDSNSSLDNSNPSKHTRSTNEQIQEPGEYEAFLNCMYNNVEYFVQDGSSNVENCVE